MRFYKHLSITSIIKLILPDAVIKIVEKVLSKEITSAFVFKEITNILFLIFFKEYATRFIVMPVNRVSNWRSKSYKRMFLLVYFPSLFFFSLLSNIIYFHFSSFVLRIHFLLIRILFDVHMFLFFLFFFFCSVYTLFHENF